MNSYHQPKWFNPSYGLHIGARVNSALLTYEQCISMSVEVTFYKTHASKIKSLYLYRIAATLVKLSGLLPRIINTCYHVNWNVRIQRLHQTDVIIWPALSGYSLFKHQNSMGRWQWGRWRQGKPSRAPGWKGRSNGAKNYSAIQVAVLRNNFWSVSRQCLTKIIVHWPFCHLYIERNIRSFKKWKCWPKWRPHYHYTTNWH